MKKITLTLAALLITSAPLLADTLPSKPAADAPRVTEPAKRPVLDQIKTFSIKPAPKQGDADKPARQPSGIEVNPWIVPSFL